MARKERFIPPEIHLKVQLSACSIDKLNRLLFRDRIWIPEANLQNEDSHLDTFDRPSVL